MICRPAHGWMWTHANIIRWTLRYGRRVNLANRLGRVLGDLDAPDGTLNVPPCLSAILERHSIFTAGEWISSFHTMRMRSPSPAGQQEESSPAIGFITASCKLTTRRCPSRWETFLRFGKSLKSPNGQK